MASLNLRYNSVGVDGARALASNTSLTSLNLEGNNIGKELLDEIRLQMAQRLDYRIKQVDDTIAFLKSLQSNDRKDSRTASFLKDSRQNGLGRLPKDVLVGVLLPYLNQIWFRSIGLTLKEMEQKSLF